MYMKTRYELFKQLAKITELVKTDTKNTFGYQKMIQTGELDFYDYGYGYIDFTIFYINAPKETYVRLWFGTYDDGDLGAFVKVTDRVEAEKLINNVVEDVFAKMRTFPTLDKLNIMVQKYGIKIEYE